MIRRILLIDFDDSFTFNLKGLLESFDLEVNIIHWSKLDENMIQDHEYFVLGPGPGHVQDYALFFDLLSLLTDKSVLGVCLGHQLLGSFLGIQLKQLSKPIHGKSLNLPELALAFSRESFSAQFYNSWYLDGKASGGGLGNFCLDEMLYYFQHLNWQGVQFHPESVGTTCPRQVMEWLLKRMYNKSYELLPSHIWDL